MGATLTAILHAAAILAVVCLALAAMLLWELRFKFRRLNGYTRGRKPSGSPAAAPRHDGLPDTGVVFATDPNGQVRPRVWRPLNEPTLSRADRRALDTTPDTSAPFEEGE
jgi:hypothetical protein